jgi:hypothetical protein
LGPLAAAEVVALACLLLLVLVLVVWVLRQMLAAV